jgi:hypothetical protein
MHIESRWGLGLPVQFHPKINLSRYSEVSLASRPFYQLGVLGLCRALHCLPTGHPTGPPVIQGGLLGDHMGMYCRPRRGPLGVALSVRPGTEVVAAVTPGRRLPNVPTFYELGGRLFLRWVSYI